MKTGTSPTASPIVHRAQANVRAVTKTQDAVDSALKSTPPTSPRLGKLIIRAAKSPERANNQDYIRTVSTVVGPTSPTSPQKQVRGAYVNMQEDEGKRSTAPSTGCSGTGRLEGTPVGQLVQKDTLHPKQNHVKPVDAPSRLRINNSVNIKGNKKRVICSPKKRNDIRRKTIVDTPVTHLNRRILNFKSGRDANLFPENLIAKGNTPKLARRLLVSDFDKLDGDQQLNNKENNVSQTDPVPTPTDESLDTLPSTPNTVQVERKIKRSESYRMANSPMLFIKKFSNQSYEKSNKIIRTPSEEIQEELLKERINYPETISSPEPPMKRTPEFSSQTLPSLLPTSPRPRATDIEPVRVLMYSGNDTEIW